MIPCKSDLGVRIYVNLDSGCSQQWVAEFREKLQIRFEQPLLERGDKGVRGRETAKALLVVHRKSPLNSRERELRRGPREGDRRMKWMEWLQPAWSTPSKDHLNKKPPPSRARATLI